MVGEMVKLSRSIPIAGEHDTMERVMVSNAAFKATLCMFAHFSYERQKQKAGGSGLPPDHMKCHFDKLLSVLRNVYKPEKPYASRHAFEQQLGRLLVHVEFNMSMPSISVKHALDLYGEEMAETKRKSMMTEPFTEDHKTNLNTGYGIYEKEFKRLELKYLSSAGRHVPALLKEILEVSCGDCFKGAVEENWGEHAEFHSTVPLLLARLAFLFSLQRSNLVKPDPDDPRLLTWVGEQGALGAVRPHCIQVLGILSLLNCAKRGTKKVYNQIAEVLTGQVKWGQQYGVAGIRLH